MYKKFIFLKLWQCHFSLQEFISTETSNKEVHIHVLTMGKNNAQNHINKKTFFTVPD